MIGELQKLLFCVAKIIYLLIDNLGRMGQAVKSGIYLMK